MLKKTSKGRGGCRIGFIAEKRVRGGSSSTFLDKIFLSILSTKEETPRYNPPPFSCPFPLNHGGLLFQFPPKRQEGSQPRFKMPFMLRSYNQTPKFHVVPPHFQLMPWVFATQKDHGPFPFLSGRKNTTHADPQPSCFILRPGSLVNGTQQLSLQDVFALLVLFRRFKSLVVLPAHRLLALPAVDVTHHVPARRHVAFDRLGLRNIHHGVEKVGFAVLTAEVLRARDISGGVRRRRNARWVVK